MIKQMIVFHVGLPYFKIVLCEILEQSQALFLKLRTYDEYNQEKNINVTTF